MKLVTGNEEATRTLEDALTLPNIKKAKTSRSKLKAASNGFYDIKGMTFD